MVELRADARAVRKVAVLAFLMVWKKVEMLAVWLVGVMVNEMVSQLAGQWESSSEIWKELSKDI